MDIRFIDTSIMTNLLDIPYRNQDKEEVSTEFRRAIEDKETLILPIATIIETGNHISHISNGDVRRNRAEKFAGFLIKTANEEAPWILYGTSIQKKELRYLAEKFQDSAMRGIGIGDLSIIAAYENYRDTMPAIGTIMIWSTDHHLSTYRDEQGCIRRRRKR